MYDLVTNEWKNFGKIPEVYSTSDNGAVTMLVKQKFMLSVDTHQPIYFNSNDVLAITFSSDVEVAVAAASSEQGSDGNLVITCHANLNTQ